jgi:hypothetical protein
MQHIPSSIKAAPIISIFAEYFASPTTKKLITAPKPLVDTLTTQQSPQPSTTHTQTFGLILMRRIIDNATDTPNYSTSKIYNISHDLWCGPSTILWLP